MRRTAWLTLAPPALGRELAYDDPQIGVEAGADGRPRSQVV